jgi:pyrroline-5-carboxylate reductase
MDAATVLASGTAFALRYIRASMQAGIEIRLANCFGNFSTNRKGAAEMLRRKSTPGTIN